MEDYYPITLNGIYNDNCRITMKAKEKFDVNITNVRSSGINASHSKDALMFVIKYMNAYGDKNEVRAPEQPLIPDVKICELFENEINIFGDIIIDIDNLTTKDALLERINYIVEIIRIEELFNLNILLDKLSAIATYCIQNPLISNLHPVDA
jgi:hypothetical protein